MRSVDLCGEESWETNDQNSVKSLHCAHRQNLKTILVNKRHLSAISQNQRSKLTKNKKLFSAFKTKKIYTSEIGKGEV